MKTYYFIVGVLRFFNRLLNGKPRVYGKENLPKKGEEAAILAATHTSNNDPVVLATELLPSPVSFMAKKELFEIPFIKWVITNAMGIPVDREKPSPKTIRQASNRLTKDNINLGIFPTGTRHSTKVQPGTAFIQGVSKKDIIPIAIQPPIGFKEYITRKKAKMLIGEPIKFDPDVKYDREKLAEVDQLIKQRFDELNEELKNLP